MLPIEDKIWLELNHTVISECKKKMYNYYLWNITPNTVIPPFL